MNTPARLRRIEGKIHTKQRSKRVIWPILGGLSTAPSVPHESSRNVTPQEAEILISKGQPVPICIALSRENEFLEYLESE